MGLDFTLFWIKKSEGDISTQYFNRWNYEDDEKHTLAYARKGWELVYALKGDVRNGGFCQLKLENWIDLMEKLSSIGPFLEEIWDAYYTLDNVDDEDIDKYPRENQLINAYMRWYNKNFNDAPQLGYQFSVGYMLNFWNAADEVIKYLEDPEYEVWMDVDY